MGFCSWCVFEKKKHQKKTVDSKIGQDFFLVVLVVRGGFFFFLCCNAWKKRSVSPVSKGVFHCGHLQDAQNLLTIRFLDEHGERTLGKTEIPCFFHMEKGFDQQRPSTPVVYIFWGLGKKSGFLFASTLLPVLIFQELFLMAETLLYELITSLSHYFGCIC